MNEIDPVNLTAELIKCPSVTPQEAGAITLIEDLLNKNGFICSRISRGGVENLFARWGSGKSERSFGYNGHTDVVPVGNAESWSVDPFGAEVKDGYLFGRGATDMKSSVAAFVASAIDFVSKNPPNGSIVITITGDEEGEAKNGTAAILDWMQKNNEKISCRGEGFVPTCAIVDFDLTLSKPRRLTIDSAIDTLTHGIEAYVSKKATLFSDRMALDTIRLVTQNIYAVDRDPKDLKAREGLMLAATLGGLAFSNASICLVHGMSRPLGSNFKVPHGLSNAMLLPTITEFSIEHAKSRYADCSRAGNFASQDDEDDIACEKLIKGLYKMNKDFDVPSMKKFGINEKNFEEKLKNMATDAEVSGAPNLNPRVPSVNEMIDLYGKAWGAF